MRKISNTREVTSCLQNFVPLRNSAKNFQGPLSSLQSVVKEESIKKRKSQ